MVRNLFSLLNTRQNSILSGATVLMFAVFASRFLGLIRDRLLAHNFTTSDASIYFAAFQWPDLIFQLLIFGALSVAFIPVFTEHLNKKGEGNAFEFASNILNLSLVAFAVVEVVIFFFVSPLNSLAIPGFTGEQKVLTDQFTRILLLSELILVVGTFFTGIAQSYQRFVVSALAPLFYNLGIIVGITILSPFIGIYGPAVGVVLGSLLHALIQFPILKSLGYKYKLSFDFFNPGVREVFSLMSFRSIGLAAELLSDKLAIALASLITYSSVTILTFAQHLQAVPIGLFGATIAQAALPVLSREHSKNEGESFKITLLTTMHQILFLTLPASAMLVVLRIPIVRLIFGASKFGWGDTVLTGRTVALLSLGVAAQSVTQLLVRSFYAYKDTKTPVVVSLLTVALNVILSLVFVSVLHLDVWSLGLSYAVTTNLSPLLLLYFLNKKVEGFNRSDLFTPALKMILAATTAAVALYIPIKALDQLVIDTTRTLNLFILTSIASVFGLAVYLLMVWLLRVKELNTYVNLIKKLGSMQFLFKTEEIVVNEPGNT